MNSNSFIIVFQNSASPAEVFDRIDHGLGWTFTQDSFVVWVVVFNQLNKRHDQSSISPTGKLTTYIHEHDSSGIERTVGIKDAVANVILVEDQRPVHHGIVTRVGDGSLDSRTANDAPQPMLLFILDGRIIDSDINDRDFNAVGQSAIVKETASVNRHINLERRTLEAKVKLLTIRTLTELSYSGRFMKSMVSMLVVTSLGASRPSSHLLMANRAKMKSA